MISGVLSGSILQGQGAVALQGLNALCRVQELERRQEVGGHSISPVELSRQMEMVVSLLHDRLPPEQFRAFSDDLDALLDEASSG